MSGKTVTAEEIAVTFRDQLRADISTFKPPPTLVGLLANDDPAALKYAECTAKACKEIGIDYQLRQFEKSRLEDALVDANNDPDVNGIMIYYPVYNNRQDTYLQNSVTFLKDVEGLCHRYIYNMYHNKRFLDEAQTQKCILPCTPLAIVKILEYLGVYNKILNYGDRLYGRTILIVNRSEIVGRPLAALLANDGAKVYSADENGVQEFHRGQGIRKRQHDVFESKFSLQEAAAQADVVICGVPSSAYKFKTEWLKDGAIAINFSSAKNFEADIKDRASIYVPSIGKVTIVMLQRNLLRLYSYQLQNYKAKQS